MGVAHFRVQTDFQFTHPPGDAKFERVFLLPTCPRKLLKSDLDQGTNLLLVVVEKSS